MLSIKEQTLLTDEDFEYILKNFKRFTEEERAHTYKLLEYWAKAQEQKTFTVDEIRKFILRTRLEIKDIDEKNVIRLLEGKNFECVLRSDFMVPHES